MSYFFLNLAFALLLLQNILNKSFIKLPIFFSITLSLFDCFFLDPAAKSGFARTKALSWNPDARIMKK